MSTMSIFLELGAYFFWCSACGGWVGVVSLPTARKASEILRVARNKKWKKSSLMASYINISYLRETLSTSAVHALNTYSNTHETGTYMCPYLICFSGCFLKVFIRARSFPVVSLSRSKLFVDIASTTYTINEIHNESLCFKYKTHVTDRIRGEQPHLTCTARRINDLCRCKSSVLDCFHICRHPNSRTELIDT